MVFGDVTGVVFAEDVGVVFAEEVGVVLRAGFVECCFVRRVTAGGRICRWRQCVCTVMHCYTTFVYIRARSFDMHFTMYVHTCSILQRFLIHVHTHIDTSESYSEEIVMQTLYTQYPQYCKNIQIISVFHWPLPCRY